MCSIYILRVPSQKSFSVFFFGVDINKRHAELISTISSLNKAKRSTCTYSSANMGSPGWRIPSEGYIILLRQLKGSFQPLEQFHTLAYILGWRIEVDRLTQAGACEKNSIQKHTASSTSLHNTQVMPTSMICLLLPIV